jgi:hypothetical protein
MKLFIDIDRVPRPERSGLISILATYLLLAAISDIQLASYPEEFKKSLHGWMAIACYLVPCSVLPGFYEKQEEEQVVERKPQHIRYVPLIFGNGTGGKPICACHVDFHYWGKPVMHLHFKNETTCDSDIPSASWRVWRSDLRPSDSTTTYSAVVIEPGDTEPRYEMKSGEGEFRFHCTTEDDRESP